MNARQRLCRVRGERGSIVVEFAIIAPILLMLVFGIFEFGLGYHAWDATQNAAREGARLGAVSPDLAEIEARVRGTTSFLKQSNLTVTIRCGHTGGPFSACPAPSSWEEGDIVRVTVDYDYGYITPLPTLVGLGGQMHMSSIAEARFEGQ